MGTHEFYVENPPKNEGKNHGTVSPKILPLFYSRITNATPLDNLERILTISHPLGWYTKDNFSPIFGGTPSPIYGGSALKCFYHLNVFVFNCCCLQMKIYLYL